MVFEEYNENCPCFVENGQCALQVTYNRSVNDPRYGSCIEHLCPAFYWAQLKGRENSGISQDN